MDRSEYGISPVDMLIATNTAAANTIAADQRGLDATGADLIMCNMAVVTDRLKSDDFAQLPKEVQDQVFAVAFMADDIAPVSEESLVRQPHESEADYDYRTGVWQRIHNLQAYVHTRSHDTDDDLELSKLRFVVQGAGRAFAAVIDATQDIPVIADTVGYFRGNTNAAVTRARHISRLAINQGSGETDR